MKKITALILALILSAGFISCQSATDISVPMGMMLASDPDIPEYVLMVPNDWTVESATGTTTAYYKDNLRNAVLATFSATFNMAEDGITLENYFDSYAEEFISVFGTTQVIEEYDTLLGGKDAKEYIYTATFGETEYKFWQVICFNEGIIYTLTYSATAQYFDNYAEDMSLILSNFYFK